MRNLMKKLPPVSILIAIFLFSVILTSCVSPLIMPFAYRLLPEEEVSIVVTSRENGTSGGNDISIADWGDQFTEACKNGNFSGIWEYKEKDDKNQWLYSRIVSSTESSSVTVLLPVNSYSAIHFVQSAEAGIVCVTAGDDIQTIDLYSKTIDYLPVFPFKDSWMSFAIRFVSLAAVCLFFFVLLTGLCLLLIRGIRLPRILSAEIKPYYIFILFTLLYGYALYQYYVIGVENLLVYGDQVHYWMYRNLFDGLRMNNAGIPSFRGYIGYWTCAFAQKIGMMIGFDPIPIFYLTTTAAMTMLLGFSFPKLYEILCGKKCLNYQYLSFIFIFMFFWNYLLTNIGMDLFGLSCFLGGVVFFLLYEKRGRIIHAGISGLLLSASVSFRMSYLYGVVAILVIVVWMQIRKWIKSLDIGEKAYVSKTESRSTSMARILTGIVAWVIAFLIICMPQVRLNQFRGHLGLFPYDYAGDYVENQTLTEYQANASLTSLFVMWPSNIPPDSQMARIKGTLVEAKVNLTLEQLMDAFISSPVDTLVYIGKKLFEGFDVRWNNGYRDYGWNFASPKIVAFYLFGLLNFLILFCGIYAGLKNKHSNLHKALFWSFFITLVLPETLFVIEWRYFLIGYCLMYYYFVFEFLPMHIDTKGNIRYIPNLKYTYSMLGFVYLAMFISQTFYR